MQYIHNYKIVTSDEIIEGKSVESDFKFLQGRTKPILVNIYASGNDDDIANNLNYSNDYSEEARKGGLGKTFLLRKIMDLYAPKASPSLIDLSGGQFNTKASIISQIMYELGEYPAYSILSMAFDEEIKKNVGSATEYDPSFVAEKALNACFAKENSIENSATPPIIFIDGYDRIHIGEAGTSLRVWLSEDLFPFLLSKMNVTVVLSGRDQLETAKKILEGNEKKQPVDYIGVRVIPFDEDQLQNYTKSFLGNETEAVKLYTSIRQWDKILKYSGGKPIFIDLFCAIMVRDCLTIKKKVDFAKFWKEIGVEDTETDTTQKNITLFKKFLVERLYLKGNDETDPFKTSDIVSALKILSIAKHGLNAEEFQEIRNKFKDSDLIEDVKDFFEHTFCSRDYRYKKNNTPSENKGLSYVKQRKDKAGNQLRLLHDEIIELLHEYFWNFEDKNHEIRNGFLFRITDYYESYYLKKPNSSDPEYARRLLEYINYLFDVRDKEKEIESLNCFLYEFAGHLDTAPDLARRILGRAIRYYKMKESPSNFEKSLQNTLTFIDNFDSLSKILTREVVYLLTERTPGWGIAVDRKIEEIERNWLKQIPSGIKNEAYSKKSRGINALRGEQYAWLSGDERALEHLKKAKKGFYLSGELYGMNWAEHLIGFVYQRDADFEKSRRHHEATITDAINNLRDLCDQLAVQKEISQAEKYHVLLYVKTLCRAGGNLAVNLRYRGRLISALTKIDSFMPLAVLTGTREKNRMEINKIQFRAIAGHNIDNIKNFTLKIPDPVLPRRLNLTELVQESKSIGLENRIYHFRREMFYEQVLQDDKSKFNSLIKKIKNLELNFVPVVRPLNMEEFNKINLKPKLREKWDPNNKDLPASRELADIYYQFGKIMLAYQLEGEESFDIAQTALENCVAVAKKSGFEYLVSEAMAALSRLFYLQWEDEKSKIIADKAERGSKRLSFEKGYMAYRDLLANHALTRGDLRLTVDPAEAVTFYIKMLSHAERHNETRYHLAIEVFCERIRYMLRQKTIDRDKIMDVYRNSPDTEKAYLSEAFLSTFLEAALLNKSESEPESRLHGIRVKMGLLMQKGETIQAGCINECLIDYYKDCGEEGHLALAMRYFQKYYIHQWTNHHAKAGKTLEEVAVKIKNTNDPYSLIWAVGRATRLYRTPDIWSFEKYVLEEMEDKQSKKSAPEKEVEKEAEKLFVEVIEVFIAEETTLPKQLKRIFAEAMLRLGELLLITGDKKVEKYKPLFAEMLSRDVFKEKLKRLHDKGIKIDGTSALFVLNMAYFYATEINDEHRILDSLQSIAAARYFNKETLSGTAGQDKDMVLDILHRKVRGKLTDNDRKAAKYSLIAGKLELIAGDIYFSELFELKTDPAYMFSEYSAELRPEHRKQEGKTLENKTKAVLKQMMWAYLSSLNVLARPNKKQESYHFENILLEINRRILFIRDPKMVRSLQTGLKGVWGSFENLAPLSEIYLSIEQELSLHEVALLAQEVLGKSSTGLRHE